MPTPSVAISKRTALRPERGFIRSLGLDSFGFETWAWAEGCDAEISTATTNAVTKGEALVIIFGQFTMLFRARSWLRGLRPARIQRVCHLYDKVYLSGSHRKLAKTLVCNV